MSSAFIVTRLACLHAAIASKAIFSEISNSDSFNAFTAEADTRSAPAFLAILSNGYKGKSLTKKSPFN